MPEHFEHSHEPVSFGKYLLDQELARGGMSRVFRARLQGPGGFEKKLVVKQILPELAADPAFVELFVKEANTLVQLSHPNLVPVYELGVVDGVYFLAMEWVQGATVAQLLASGPLTAALVAQIGAQIAEALHYAHEQFGIVHRDVTPRNIIVDAAGHARLLDFGIAARTEQTGQGELFGSFGYMAPEQLRGEALGPESDLFSLGSVLYEAVSGRQAWPNARSAKDLAASPAPARLDHIDPLLSELILGLLAVPRAERPQPASLVAERLRTWLSTHNPRGVSPELAERVSRVRTQPALVPPPRAEALRENSGRIEVRSIAVNQQLSELLREATERLERPAPPAPEAAPAESLGNDPEMHRVARRFIRDIVVVTLALVAALTYARMARERPPDPPATGKLPSASPRDSVALAPPAQAPKEAPARPETPTVNPEPPASAEAKSEPPSAAESPKKRGSLSVSAMPWAEVRVDGKLLGTTPRRNLPLRAGKHTLSLSCPPLAHAAEVPIEVTSGHELHVSANMHESPPQLDIRSAQFSHEN